MEVLADMARICEKYQILCFADRGTLPGDVCLTRSATEPRAFLWRPIVLLS